MEDLNADVGQMGHPRNQQKDDLLESFWMVDLLGHFMHLQRFRLKQTWWQVHRSKLLCSQCNYILGSDHWLFKIVVIRDLRNVSSDNFALHLRLMCWTNKSHS